MDNEKGIIFILPHLNVDTTSTARFKSFILSFIEDGLSVKIITFNYPVKKNIGLGHQVSAAPLESVFENLVVSVSPKLNSLQQVAFFVLNTFDFKLWKLFNWFHQAVYGVDVFSPGKVNLETLRLDLHKDQTVIACGGPFGIYSYANQLALRLKAKLVLDYRDPWTFGYVPLGAIPLIYGLKVKLNRSKEVEFLKNSSLITTVSPSLKQMFPQSFHAKVKVVENGSNFTVADVESSSAQTFNLVYLGTLYDDQLADETIMKAIKLFLNSVEVPQIRLQFLGSSDNKHVDKLLKKYGLDTISEVTERLPSHEVKNYLNKASVFLQLKYGDRSDIITSKQADYLLFNKPILLPVSDNGDISDSIIKNESGFVCNTVDDNVKVLSSLWSRFLKRESTCIRKENTDAFRDNNRRSVAGKFVEFVKSC